MSLTSTDSQEVQAILRRVGLSEFQALVRMVNTVPSTADSANEGELIETATVELFKILDPDSADQLLKYISRDADCPS